ncbi:MAG: hypothetical protein GQ569_12655 [Methylococcaceae bacterium]|nr:hypothetical protein [Methylococcaceae bacterium]
MNIRVLSSLIRSTSMVLIASTFLYGCGSGDKPSSAAIKKAMPSFKKATTLKGLVTDNKGVVKAGEVKVTDAKNKVIASGQLDTDGHYKVKIPAKTSVPILLKVQPSEDSKADELMAAVVYTSMTKFDINPLSTKIAKKAKELGGYTHANMILAAESMVDMPDKNKTTSGFRGDPTKQYGGWH